jgi:hypothetical protein
MNILLMISLMISARNSFDCADGTMDGEIGEGSVTRMKIDIDLKLFINLIDTPDTWMF